MSPEIHKASQAFRDAFAQTKTEKLNFPTHLDISQRLLKALESPDTGLSALAKIVASEPLLSAKLIRLANSMAMNPANQPIRDLRGAVIHVGVNPVKTLAMALILNQMRQLQKHENTREISNRLWERSISVATLAYVITRKMTSLNPDEAMFVGIVHDLGRFYLLAQATAYPLLLNAPVALAQIINDLGEEATCRVFNELRLPSPIAEAVFASRQYGQTMPPANLGDVLFVASALSPRPDPFNSATPEGTDEHPGAAFGLDQSAVAAVIAASGDEIHSIIVALEA